MVQEKVLRIEPDLSTAYIHPYFWRKLDAKQKENFAFLVAVYCGNKRGSTTYRAEIYDDKSAKKLAKYSRVTGFEVY